MKNDLVCMDIWNSPELDGLRSSINRDTLEISDRKFPLAKVHENADGFVVMLSAPEFNEDDLEIVLGIDELQITGWCLVTNIDPVSEALFIDKSHEVGFIKTFYFPVPIRVDAIQTRFEEGGLHLVWLPKKTNHINGKTSNDKGITLEKCLRR